MIRSSKYFFTTELHSVHAEFHREETTCGGEGLESAVATIELRVCINLILCSIKILQ